MKFLVHKFKPFQKKKPLNPRQVWKLFCLSFLSVLLMLLGYFTFYFFETIQTLDTPPTASFQTNAGKIITMDKMLSETEAAIQARTGKPVGQ